jgi:periplasmic divalent cation tolerance protein
MKSETIAIIITAPSMDVAEKIADILVESKLAACVNISSPIRSIYSWEGKIVRDDEVLMIAKTRADLFGKEFIQTVKSNHPYQVPEIIALPILDGSADYLAWISDVTRV